MESADNFCLDLDQALRFGSKLFDTLIVKELNPYKHRFRRIANCVFKIVHYCFGCWFLFKFCRLPFFKKKKSFRNIRVANGSDPDQDRCSVGPDLGPIGLPRLSADELSLWFKTLQRRGHSLKSHPTDRWSRGSNSGLLSTR